MGNSKEKLSIPVMIFCILGIVLVGLGFMLIKSNNFKLNVIPTKATITSTQTARDGNGNESTAIVANYSANNSLYNATITTDDLSKYQLGNEIIIYHDFFSPESVSLNFSGYFGYIALIIGLLLVFNTGPRFYRIVRDNYIIPN